MKLLQHFVVPYVRLDNPDERPTIGTVHGTAFFINSNGAFLTARHVVENCEADIKDHGGVAALVMSNEEHPEVRFAGRVERRFFPDKPYDVAVGTVRRKSKGYFVFDSGVKAWMWEDVYTAGYPVSATTRRNGDIRIDARGLKGEILRRLPAGDILIHPHPDIIEVSFAITRGMSGAPLVMRNAHDQNGNPIPYFVLLGVCVGNEPSQIVDFSHTEVQDGGKEFKERIARIEEYGLVHDIRPLKDWKPECLSPLTLGEAIQPDAN